MKPEFDTSKGWTEAIIDADCEFGEFHKVADLMSSSFHLTFTNKVHDFDTLYWDFEYNAIKLVLHYNTFQGISIFPKACKSATQADNDTVIEFSTNLLQRLIDQNWSDLEEGITIGTRGSEAGTIIFDQENSHRARITLEKECGNIEFATTIGIYGLTFLTNYHSYIEEAHDYIAQAKFKINKILSLYDVPEEKRDSTWRFKQKTLLTEISNMI